MYLYFYRSKLTFEITRYDAIRNGLSYYDKYKRIIHEARKTKIPRTPGSLEELGDMIEKGEFPEAKPYFKGIVRGEDHSVALMFGSDMMVNEVLPEIAQAINDGTFKV